MVLFALLLRSFTSHFISHCTSAWNTRTVPSAEELICARFEKIESRLGQPFRRGRFLLKSSRFRFPKPILILELPRFTLSSLLYFTFLKRTFYSFDLIYLAWLKLSFSMDRERKHSTAQTNPSPPVSIASLPSMPSLFLPGEDFFFLRLWR